MKPKAMADLASLAGAADRRSLALNARCCGSSALRVTVDIPSGVVTVSCWLCRRTVEVFQVAPEGLAS